MARMNAHGGWDLTDEDVAEVVASSFPDAEPGVAPLCPECKAGKHVNCTGVAWDDFGDAETKCRCGDDSHLTQVIHAAIQEAASTYHPLIGEVGSLCVLADDMGTAAASSAEGGGIPTLTWEQAIHALSALRQSVETIRQIDAALTRHLYMCAPHGDIEVEGIGMVGIRRANDRKEWSHEDWKKDVRGAALEKTGATDEVFTADGESFNLAELLILVQDVHGATAPKVTALKKLGLDPQAYCEERPGQPQVVFPRRD